MSGDGLRLDKWLWHARFYKSRTLAAAACSSGRIRINGVPVAKSHRQLKPGDVLTFPHGTHIRIIRVLALGSRRGPASEARLLYQDLAPPGATGPTFEPLSPVHESACRVAEQGAPPQTASEAPPES
jgi:ribosome-associated heat shock protein Hsp15